MRAEKANVASHIMIACLIAGVLVLKLSAGVIAGFLVYCVSRQLEYALALRYPTMRSRGVAPAFVIACVVVAVLGAVLACWQLVKGQHGVAGVSDMMVSVLSRMHGDVPAWLDAYLPASTDDAKAKAVEMLRKYSEQISAVGMGTLRGLAHVLIGIVVAAMLAWSKFAPANAYKPLSAAVFRRFSGLVSAFERVVFAQVRISLLNTVFSALYLQVVLPVAGVHVPFSKTLVAFTFVAGMLPVVGNLVSNTAILVVTLGVSFNAALASLAYLVVIHKLEYFFNARIVGHRIEASAWEIILVIAGMEALFGLQGVIVAPVLYAYVKGELKAANLIGRVEGPVVAAMDPVVGGAPPQSIGGQTSVKAGTSTAADHIG